MIRIKQDNLIIKFKLITICKEIPQDHAKPMYNVVESHVENEAL